MVDQQELIRKNKKRNRLAGAGLLLVALIWGTGFVSSKAALDGMSPMLLMAVRFSIGFLLSLLIFFKHLKDINRETLVGGLVIGLFLFGAFACQMIGLQYIQAGKQAFLMGANVIMVPFLYWLVSKRPPNKYNFIAAFMMLIGLAFLTINPSGGFSFTFSIGDWLTLLCAFLFACHITATGHYANKDTNTIGLTIIQLGVAAAISVLWCLIAGESFSGTTANAIGNAIYLGVFPTFLAFLLQTVCQRYTTSTQAAILMCFETVFGNIFSVLLLGERFSAQMLIGFAVIFLAIITSETQWAFLKKRKAANL